MENTTRTSPSDIKHRSSFRRHQSQRFWQILLPVILGGLVVVAVIVLVILTAAGGDPVGQVSIWADTSLIWLILPALLFAVIVLLIIGGMIYLLTKLLRIIPTYSTIAQDFVGKVAEGVRNVADKIASPFIAVKGAEAATGKFFEKLLAFFHHS